MPIPDPNDIISNWIREEAKKHEKKSEDTIAVTDLVMCPMRRLFAIKYPEIAEASMFSQYATHGTVVHEGLERILKDEYEAIGYKVSPELDVSKTFGKYTVKGRLDLLITDFDGNKIVIDIKNPKIRGPSWPSEHHIMQVQIYMNMINTNYGMIYYFTHDGRASYPVNEPLSDEEILELIDQVLHPSQENSPRYDWECRGYCPYAQMCPFAKIRWSR